MDTFASIIDRWPSLHEFAADIKVRYVTAQLMRHRNSIASKHWKAVVDGAEKRRINGVTLEALAEIAADERHKPENPKRRASTRAAA